MQYEITISGRSGAESEERARETVRLLVSAFKAADVSYNLDIWDTKQNTVTMAVHGIGNQLPKIIIPNQVPG
ncbi:hypothetical protein [Paramagnetospirillum magneticum]|nr:hypothetical protein [Paramagnetospirillum magneticum]